MILRSIFSRQGDEVRLNFDERCLEFLPDHTYNCDLYIYCQDNSENAYEQILSLLPSGDQIIKDLGFRERGNGDCVFQGSVFGFLSVRTSFMESGALDVESTEEEDGQDMEEEDAQDMEDEVAQGMEAENVQDMEEDAQDMEDEDGQGMGEDDEQDMEEENLPNMIGDDHPENQMLEEAIRRSLVDAAGGNQN